jgi:orotate phosphoribosyltransferase
MKSLELLNDLIKINSIKINLKNSFLWASGWKSPFYFDNRISLSYPNIRKEITKRLVSIIKEKYDDVEIIAGVATAGIPQGALVAENLNLPFAYVRSKPKSHGMKNMIEGRIEKGKRVLLIEDLISTGGSSIKSVESVRDIGSIVIGVLSIFNYGLKVSEENFKNTNCDTNSIFNYNDLLSIALKNNYIEDQDFEKLKSWRDNPEKWK